MDNKIIEKIGGAFLKKRPEIKIGDTIQVSIKIKETGRERTQIFEGILIAMSGSGLDKTITVRKISYGVGVERIFPLHSPSIEKIKILKRGDIRRAKLYYMRDKKGKSAMDVGNTGEQFEDVIEEEIIDNREEIKEEKAEPVAEVKEEVVVEKPVEEKTPETKTEETKN